MEDKKLISRLRGGDEAALEKIIGKYTGYVSAVILNQLGGMADISAAEELTADVFFGLWKNRAAIKTNMLRGWLGAAARNKARDHIRSKHIEYVCSDEDIIIVAEDNSFDRLGEREQNAVLRSALNKLRKEEREVIVRHYYYNQTVKRISEETKVNVETVKSRLRRGRGKLKEILEKGGYFS